MEGTLRAYQRMQTDTRMRQCNRVSFISDRNLTLIKYRQNKPEQYKQSGWKAREAVRSRSQVYRKMTVIGAGFVRSTPPIKWSQTKIIVCRMRKRNEWSYVITENYPKRALTVDQSSIMIGAAERDLLANSAVAKNIHRTIVSARVLFVEICMRVATALLKIL